MAIKNFKSMEAAQRFVGRNGGQITNPVYNVYNSSFGTLVQLYYQDNKSCNFCYCESSKLKTIKITKDRICPKCMEIKDKENLTWGELLKRVNPSLNCEKFLKKI